VIQSALRWRLTADCDLDYWLCFSQLSIDPILASSARGTPSCDFKRLLLATSLELWAKTDLRLDLPRGWSTIRRVFYLWVSVDAVIKPLRLNGVTDDVFAASWLLL